MGRLRAEGTAADGPKAFSVTEAAELIRRSVEADFADITVEGSLSGAKIWGTSGHLYFKLEDDGAVIDAAMWRADVRLLAFEPVNGMRVRARGKITFFARAGRLQMACRTLEPAGGVGERERRLRELRARLEAEGALAPSRKRAIPTMPRRIGLVTSLDGAVIRDLLTVILRRFPRAHLVVVPVRVQGEGAAESIADGVRRAAAAGVDVMVVGRGGGSKEDLWAFNEEPVARALFACPVPTVSAVGHETDHTLADDVADLRAATPSQAGELVVPELHALEATLVRGALRMADAVRTRFVAAHGRLEAAAARAVFEDPTTLLEGVRQALDDAEGRLGEALARTADARRTDLRASARVLDAHRPSVALRDAATRVSGAASRLHAAAGKALAARVPRLSAAGATLDALNPVAVLGRGFSLTRVMRDGRSVLLRSGESLAPGDRLVTSVARGDDIVSTVDGSRTAVGPRSPRGCLPSRPLLTFRLSRPMPESDPKPSFETKLADLERLIRDLEGGRLGLEESIATFEEGKALHRELMKQLGDYERRIEILTRDDAGTDRLEDGSRLDPAGGATGA
jgi:exodeoxyribonuclease VII large subunit